MLLIHIRKHAYFIGTVASITGRTSATHLPLLDGFPDAFLYSFHRAEFTWNDFSCFDICFDRQADAVELWAELSLVDILTGNPEGTQIRVSFTSTDL